MPEQIFVGIKLLNTFAVGNRFSEHNINSEQSFSDVCVYNNVPGGVTKIVIITLKKVVVFTKVRQGPYWYELIWE